MSSVRGPQIGWDQAAPIPANFQMSDFISLRERQVFLDQLNLTALITPGRQMEDLRQRMTLPLEIVYLPIIRKKIRRLQSAFRQAVQVLDYPGRFIYAYASKANAAEEVVRTVLQTGVVYELSSFVDVEIVFEMIARGWMPEKTPIICNGFKQTGTLYAQKIVELQRRHGAVMPVIEDFSELPFLVDSGLHFDVGLRLKSYGEYLTQADQDAADSRFGLPSADLMKAARQIAAAPNLDLTILHAMVGSQIVDEANFVERLRPAMALYADLKKDHPGLSIFNYGGGIPVPMAMDVDFDYEQFAHLLLSTLQTICQQAGVPTPDVMGEMGRFTVAEHGAQVFRILSVKENGSQLPWYILNGSTMSSFPDTWALTEHFTVLPLNNLDGPFRKVKLGGLTCDSDDIYPPKKSQAELWLPANAEGLIICFFNIGAYQEMLGGVGGSKHCVIPEANELIVDQTPEGDLTFELISGQSAEAVLENLGYLRDLK